MTDSDIIRLLPDDPQASFAERLLLAADLQPSLIEDGFIDVDGAISIIARRTMESRRIQFITEDWAMERDMREGLEAVIEQIFAGPVLVLRRVDGTDITENSSWIVIGADTDPVELVKGWDDEPADYEVIGIDVTPITSWTSQP